MQNPAPTDAPPDSPTGAPQARSSRAGNLIGIGAGALVLGLLIWAKLQLVTNLPRTAIADPKNSPPPPAATSSADPHQ